jgi:hypothetical protein
MHNLSTVATQVANFTLWQRSNDTVIGNDTNSTYWRLYVPPGVAGNCNGSIIFTAVPA